MSIRRNGLLLLDVVGILVLLGGMVLGTGFVIALTSALASTANNAGWTGIAVSGVAATTMIAGALYLRKYLQKVRAHQP